MNNFIKKNTKITYLSKKGFVLPFTLFVCLIMILITASIATILNKQNYFSNLARQSQAAYYAADNAITCTIMVDGTYTDENGMGIIPYATTSQEDPQIQSDAVDKMQQVLDYVNNHRAMATPPLPSLAPRLEDIKCGQSSMFNVGPPSTFTVSPVTFSHFVHDPDVIDTPGDPVSLTLEEFGRTSFFDMKMDLGGGNFRCARVTVNKTQSYRQIIAQGYAVCDRPDGSVERAVVDTTVLK